MQRERAKNAGKTGIFRQSRQKTGQISPSKWAEGCFSVLVDGLARVRQQQFDPLDLAICQRFFQRSSPKLTSDLT
jgi:hypothetical protein